MCKLPYTAKWPKGFGDRCPNLIPTVQERELYRNLTTFEVEVEVVHGYVEHYESLASMWSEWLRVHLDAPWPRLMIRFEDTIFHAEAVMKVISECVGIQMSKSFKYDLNVSKPSKKANGFVSAMIKYGQERGRFQRLTDDEREYLQVALDPEIMNIFRYPQVPVKNSSKLHRDEEDSQGEVLIIHNSSKSSREDPMG